MKKLIFILAILSFNLQAKTILFIGDSHSVGPFGWTLDQLLRDEGHTVATYASCGSIGKWWFSGQKTTCGFFSRDILGAKIQIKESPTPLLPNLLSEIKPEIVIMEFGGNYIKMPHDEFVIQDIQRMVSTVKESGAQCFWVTNPDTRVYRSEIPRIIGLIKKAIGNHCPVFESQLVTRYPETGGDGIHYWNPLGTPIAKEWAIQAFNALKSLN